MPLSEGELRIAWGLVERAAWELDDARLAEVSGLGISRRRIWLEREVTGPWLYDAIDGDSALMRLGPEAVWATSASSIDHWIATRSGRSYPGDAASLPANAPALDVRFERDRPATKQVLRAK
ncbi:MAG TPA: hypothetical protein VI814_09715 [Candidatus Limnocylindria bacterium]